MTALVVTLLRFVNIAFEVYFIILLIRVVLSWIRISPYSKFYQFIFNMTEPLLAPIRRLTKVSPTMPVDFSPMILMLILIVVERLVYFLITLLL
ncbi:MAG: YggT family protein [Bacillota bacterium]|nr:YggT family protein [Bacillota bacterium]